MNSKERFLTAHKLLLGQTTSLEKLEAVTNLIKGIDPRVDRLLTKVNKAFSQIENLRKGDIISLFAESLPQQTEKDKKRKKAILLLIKSWKELSSEVARVKGKLESQGKDTGAKQQAQNFAEIFALSKGPFGLITLAAVIIVGVLILVNRGEQQSNIASQPVASPSVATSAPTATATQSPTPSVSPSSKRRIKVITFAGKKIPLSELTIGEGPDCAGPHYHALDHTTARAIDGTTVSDPGGCGFGQVSQVAVEEIDSPN